MATKKKLSALDRAEIAQHKAGDHKYRKDPDYPLCRKGKK
jgi:hypothetical protein